MNIRIISSLTLVLIVVNFATGCQQGSNHLSATPEISEPAPLHAAKPLNEASAELTDAGYYEIPGYQMSNSNLHMYVR